MKITNISALNDLDHRIGIDYLSDDYGCISMGRCKSSIQQQYALYERRRPEQACSSTGRSRSLVYIVHTAGVRGTFPLKHIYTTATCVTVVFTVPREDHDSTGARSSTSSSRRRAFHVYLETFVCLPECTRAHSSTRAEMCSYARLHVLLPLHCCCYILLL